MGDRERIDITPGRRDLAREDFPHLFETFAKWGVIERASGGDQFAIRTVLKHFAEALEECQYFPPEVTDFLIKGLTDLEHGRGLKAPFGLKPKRGEKPGDREARAKKQRFALAIARKLHALKLRSNEEPTRSSVEAAIEAVHDETGRAFDVLWDDWGKHKAVAWEFVVKNHEMFGEIQAKRRAK